MAAIATSRVSAHGAVGGGAGRSAYGGLRVSWAVRSRLSACGNAPGNGVGPAGAAQYAESQGEPVCRD